MKYLFDTNILIYFFNGSLPDELKDLVAEIRNVEDFNNIDVKLINPFQ
jgi:predicted nucleic acid-binding protein